MFVISLLFQGFREGGAHIRVDPEPTLAPRVYHAVYAKHAVFDKWICSVR